MSKFELQGWHIRLFHVFVILPVIILAIIFIPYWIGLFIQYKWPAFINCHKGFINCHKGDSILWFPGIVIIGLLLIVGILIDLIIRYIQGEFD